MNSQIFHNFLEDSLHRVDHLYYGIELNTEEILAGMGIEENHPEFQKVKEIGCQILISDYRNLINH